MEIVFDEQKQLLKTCEKSANLSASENGIAFLLISMRFFAKRRFRNESYSLLCSDKKERLSVFARAGKIEAKERKKAVKSNSKKTIESAPIMVKARKRVLDNENERFVRSNIFQLYNLCEVEGFTWEEISGWATRKLGKKIDRRTLRKYYLRHAPAHGLPIRIKLSKSEKMRTTRNASTMQVINAILEVNLDRMYHLYTAENKSWREITKILVTENEINIPHSTVYNYFRKNAYRYPPLPIRSKPGRPKKKE
jgi:hypothetical protein